MYIGKLNDKIENITFDCKKKATNLPICCLKEGNPFKQELLHIEWSKLTTDGIDLSVSLPDYYYIASIVIQIQDACNPTGFALYTNDGLVLLSKFSAQTNSTLNEKEILLTADRRMNTFLIQIDADYTDILIDSIEIYGAVFEGEQVFPVADNIVLKNGSFLLKDRIPVSVKTDSAIAAFSVLKEKLQEEIAVELFQSLSGEIIFEQEKAIKANGYKICVTEDKIVINASDKRGFVQGAETILKLLTGNEIPSCEIEDEPFCEFRGVHLFLPAEDQMDFTKRLIKYLLSPMGYNFIILQFSAGMVLDNHPEINASFLQAIEKSSKGEWPQFPHDGVAGGKLVSKESVREFVAYARSYGIEIIPEIQSLGHVQYLTLSHPEIAEVAEENDNRVVDLRVEDARPEEFYKHSYCPSNPKTYELLFEVADEIIEVVQPVEYVHMGHDEVYQIGICPLCKHRDPADIFVEDISKIYNYLKSKSLKMMIWSDMLQPVTRNNAYKVIHKIPKDIMLLDFIWYFHMDDELEDNLLQQGFEVMVGNLYSSHYPRYEKRIRKEGMRGGQLSAWVKTAEYEMGREGKLYDLLYTAQMLWSEKYDDRLRYVYDRLIRGFLPQLRADIRKRYTPSQNKKASIKELDAGNVSDCFESLIFEHYTNSYYRRQPWVDLCKIAEYEVCYEDSCVITVPVTYGGNIGYRYRKQNQPLSGEFYRHNGYSSSWFVDSYAVEDAYGKESTVYCYEWINPCPEKKIFAIHLKSVDDAETTVTLYSVKGVKI